MIDGIDEIDGFIILFCNHLSEINEKIKEGDEVIKYQYVVTKNDDCRILNIEMTHKNDTTCLDIPYSLITSSYSSSVGDHYAYGVNSSIISQLISAGKSDATKIKYTRVYSKVRSDPRQ